jgi:hypothetical protein
MIARHSYVSQRFVPRTPDIVAIPDVPETIREAAQPGKLVPFVGARVEARGLSRLG